MDRLYARSVFFVRDTPSAMAFYTQKLGFSLDWTYEEKGRPYVVQVSLLGMEIILNQTEDETGDCPGHGRIFVGLSVDQSIAFLEHVQRHGILIEQTQWGNPTLAMTDMDHNEYYFWLPDSQRASWLAALAARGGG